MKIPVIGYFTDQIHEMGEVKLTIELVPEGCWFSNVRSNVSKQDWDILRKESYKKANYLCEICGGKGDAHPVECHEVWSYNDETQVQSLVRLISLCPNCHEVKHIGFAKVRGRLSEATAHLMKVNNWDFEKANKYIDLSFRMWMARSLLDWTLDLSWLENKKVSIIKKETI